MRVKILKFCLLEQYNRSESRGTDVIILIGQNHLTFNIIFYSSENCGAEEFQCYDGTCLSIDKRCNNITECSTREDEEGCQSPYDNGFYGKILVAQIYLYVYLYVCMDFYLIV